MSIAKKMNDEPQVYVYDFANTLESIESNKKTHNSKHFVPSQIPFILINKETTKKFSVHDKWCWFVVFFFYGTDWFNGK